MSLRPLLRRRLAALIGALALVAAASALPSAVAAPPTSPTASGTLIYLKGHDVYLARPDGTGERRLTSNGTAAEPWVSPSGDDLGNVVAARGNVVYRMDRTGVVISSFDPPDTFDVWGHQYGGAITRAAVSPDGGEVAYTYRDFHCIFSVCRDYWATAISPVDGTGPQIGFGSAPLDHPTWITDSRLLGNGSPGEGLSLFDLEDGVQDWFHEGAMPLYTAVTEPTVTSDGTRLAAIRGTGDQARLVTYAIEGDIRLGDDLNVPAQVCEGGATTPSSPAFSPDGASIAWVQPDGIWSRSALSDCAAPGTLVIPGAFDVSWAKPSLPAPPPDPQAKVLTLKRAPKVSGKARVGRVLRVRGAVWSASPRAVTYQWLRNGKSIAKAKRASYRLTRKDRGQKVSVRIVASKPGYRGATWTSKRVRVRR